MKAWGLSQGQLEMAAWRASARIGPETRLCLREVNEHGERVKTITFLLRFESSTRRLLKREQKKLNNEAEYPPGILVRPHTKSYQVIDPIPASEVGAGGIYRTEYRTFRRGCGAPCWHAFGHFLRCCFEINPEGRIKTGLADYRGMAGFEENFKSTNVEKGSRMEPAKYATLCDCHHYGVTRF